MPLKIYRIVLIFNYIKENYVNLNKITASLIKNFDFPSLPESKKQKAMEDLIEKVESELRLFKIADSKSEISRD